MLAVPPASSSAPGQPGPGAQESPDGEFQCGMTAPQIWAPDGDDVPAKAVELVTPYFVALLVPRPRMPAITVVLEPQPATILGTVRVAHVDPVLAVRALDRDLERWLAEPGVDEAESKPGLTGGLGSAVGVADDLAGLVDPSQPWDARPLTLVSSARSTRPERSIASTADSANGRARYLAKCTAVATGLVTLRPSISTTSSASSAHCSGTPPPSSTGVQCSCFDAVDPGGGLAEGGLSLGCQQS